MKTKDKIKLLDFKLTKSIGNNLFGLYKSKFYGNGIDFSEHREYNFGDSIKNIDWKASSKSEKIYKKIFEEERDLQILFVLDLRKSMFFGFERKTKRDILEEIFYSLSFSAYKNSDSIGAFLFDENNITFLPYKKDFGNIFKIIKIIENTGKDLENIGKNNLENVLENVKKRNTKNTLIFILTDELGENQNILKTLNLQNEIIFINIFDYFENNLEKLNSNLTFENAGKSLQISLNNDKKIKEYSKNRDKKLERFKNILKKIGVKNIQIDTKKDAFKEILKGFI